MKEIISGWDWKSEFQYLGCDVERKWQSFKKMYDKLIASYVPCQKANCESHKKHVNKEVLRTIR